MKNKYVFVTVMLAVLLFLGVGLTEIYVNHTEEKRRRTVHSCHFVLPYVYRRTQCGGGERSYPA